MRQIALMGCGIVGGGIPVILRDNAEILERSLGDRINLKYILELRDCSKEFYGDHVITDFSLIENDPEIEIVAECIGGSKIAYEFVKRCLLAGKSVVTSNKQLIAEKGLELLTIAKEKNVFLLFEASVGGGIPLIRPLANDLSANRIEEIYGIVNGTTNYILTQMLQHGESFENALKEAQCLGYAEADPTADVEGYDAMRKLCILSNISFGSNVPPGKVKCQGISEVGSEDALLAKNMGYAIKLLAYAKRLEGESFTAFVSPHLVSLDSVLGNVSGVMNAMVIKGNAVGECLFYGPGAGRMPTASAVVADILDILRREKSVKYISWTEEKPEHLIDPDSVPSRWYVRYRGPEISNMEKSSSLEDGTRAAITPCMTKAYMEQLFHFVEMERIFRVLD